MSNKYKCKLCGNLFKYSQMSDEHYPAKCVGNNDIVKLNFTKTLDLGMSGEIVKMINSRNDGKKTFEEIISEIFDEELSEPAFPKGRTARSLCINCNKKLGKYDEVYKRFFDLSGNPKDIKGFTKETKLKIIKSIYGKFLSIPETKDEEFDFVDFVRNENNKKYKGKWNIYFVKRDYSTDILNYRDISTGKLEFDDGPVYELTDEKFIYDLTQIDTPYNKEMNNIFDIMSSNYNLVEGIHNNSGGYHGQLIMLRMFTESEEEE